MHNVDRKSSVEMANLIQSNESATAESSLVVNQTESTSQTPNIETETTENINVLIVDPKESRGTKTPAKRTQNTAATVATRSTPTTVAASTNQRGQIIDDEEEEEIVLKYGASHVVKLFVPVTICLVFVIISLSLVTSYQESGGATLVYTPFNEDSQSNGTKLWMSIANASIFISVVIVMTIVLIVLYKYKFYRVIHGWLAFSSLMLLFFFTYMYISELFKQFNVVADMFTIVFLLWNFGILGMFCIHWKGPLFLQQVFLIFSCIQMALIFIKYLPEWTTWVLLALISIWDLVAVLCPFGPLRILVETAHSRNDNLFPAMVYSSTLMYGLVNMADTQQSTQQISQINTESDDGGFANNSADYAPASTRSENRTIATAGSENLRSRHTGRNEHTTSESTNLQQQLKAQAKEEQENGVKLGLGDFIFYSILVGKASILGDWNTVIACVVAILIGLCLTLVLLAVFHKPLPALPISLLFGLIFYFLTNLVVRPFYETLTYKQVFI